MSTVADTLIVAHRGAWDAHPENTLAAFEAAIALGADMLELDVRLSADGQLVVVHDAQMAGGRPVATLAAAKILAGSSGEPVPRLEHVLELAHDRIRLDVELKVPEPVAEVVALLRDFGPDRCLLSSFLPAPLARAKQLAPELSTALLTTASARPTAAADQLGLQARLASPPALHGLAAAGHRCLVWTVNEPASIDRLLAAPAVGAIVTDRPALAVARRAALSLSDRTAPAEPR